MTGDPVRKAVHLDERRRLSLGRIGKKEHTIYEVWEATDGEIRLVPVELQRAR